MHDPLQRASSRLSSVMPGVHERVFNACNRLNSLDVVVPFTFPPRRGGVVYCVCRNPPNESRYDGRWVWAVVEADQPRPRPVFALSAAEKIAFIGDVAGLESEYAVHLLSLASSAGGHP